MNQPLQRSIVGDLLWVLVAALMSGQPAVASAAERHMLTVVIRAGDAGVGNIALHIRDEAGTRDLAQGVTDRSGRVMFRNLEARAVRVVAEGVLPNNTRLFQRGADRSGIWLFLDSAQITLDLLVEPDGAIIPDPASMISPDTPVEAFPPRTAVVVATRAPASAVPQPIVQPVAASADTPPRWLPLGILVLAAVMLIAARSLGGR